MFFGHFASHEGALDRYERFLQSRPDPIVWPWPSPDLEREEEILQLREENLELKQKIAELQKDLP